MIGELSPWDSSVFKLKVLKAEVADKKEAEELPLTTDLDRRIGDVIFVKTPHWIYPKGQVTALDHRYEMMAEIRRPSPFGLEILTKVDRVAVAATKPDNLRQIARTAFQESRFFRDPKLADKAPDMYARWLEEGGDCWVLAGFEERAFLVQSKDSGRCGRVSLIAVDEDARGYRIGKRLLQAVMQSMDFLEWRVCVTAYNTVALRLYASVGFRVVGMSTAYHIWA